MKRLRVYFVVYFGKSFPLKDPVFPMKDQFLYPLQMLENQRFSGGIGMEHWTKIG